jgi:hypothetical protein
VGVERSSYLQRDHYPRSDEMSAVLSGILIKAQTSSDFEHRHEALGEGQGRSHFGCHGCRFPLLILASALGLVARDWSGPRWASLTPIRVSSRPGKLGG